MPLLTKTQQRAAMAYTSMSEIEKEMLANLESTMYVANSAGDPHHWERSTFGAVRTALVTTVQAVIDRTNRNTPPDAARTLAKHVVNGMIDNHENAVENLRLIARGVR